MLINGQSVKLIDLYSIYWLCFSLPEMEKFRIENQLFIFGCGTTYLVVQKYPINKEHWKKMIILNIVPCIVSFNEVIKDVPRRLFVTALQ